MPSSGLSRLELFKNRRFGGTYRIHYQGEKMMKAISCPETSVLARTIRRNNPEDCILHSHRRENLKSYMAFTGWAA
jgi:hypothetical protein